MYRPWRKSALYIIYQAAPARSYSPALTAKYLSNIYDTHGGSVRHTHSYTDQAKGSGEKQAIEIALYSGNQLGVIFLVQDDNTQSL